jgi:CDP-diacylglycerol--glycerol-3-phosphate 3-phosphatidyltransferase
VLDLACSLGMVGALVVLTFAYAARRLTRGDAHYERVDAAGTSPFLGKSAMEMTYWGLQPVARACVAIGLRANAVTGISLVLALAAAVVLALGHFGVASVLVTISFLCDAVDGLVARQTGTASDAGEVFDAAVDRYAELFFFGGLAVAYRESVQALLLVLFALAGSLMVSYATAKAEALRVEAPRGAMRRPERAVYLGLGTVLVPIVQHIVPDAAFPWPAQAPMLVVLALVGVVANASAVRRLATLAARLRAGANTSRVPPRDQARPAPGARAPETEAP